MSLALVTTLASAPGCSFDLGEICLDSAGYQPGRSADQGSGTLAGTHLLVGVDLFAVGAEEGVLIRIPDEAASSGVLIKSEGAIQIVDEFAQCNNGAEELRKVHITADAGGEGKIVVQGGDGATIAVFNLPVTKATSLEIATGSGPFIVGQPRKVCAVAFDDQSRSLYVDDSMTWSSTGSVTLSILDPGNGCHDVTPSAAGTFDLSVSALGLSATITLDAINQTQP